MVVLILWALQNYNVVVRLCVTYLLNPQQVFRGGYRRMGPMEWTEICF